MSRESVKS